MPLTDTACRNAKPKEKDYKLADSAGLSLLVKTTGRRYWRMKYRYLGKEKLMAFGTCPETTLAEAREKRDKARKLISNGVDPGLEKKAEKQLRTLNNQNTFEVIAREWHSNRIATWTPGHGANILHRLEQDVFPRIGSRPIGEIEAPELLAVLRKVEERGALEIAKRLSQTCGQVFRYAIATGRTKYNPVPDLKDALKPMVKGHYAAIEINELPAFLETLERNDARLYALTRIAIRLMLLTFVRTGELIGARWSESDFEEKMWIIPAERMKMRTDHMVPLSSQTLLLLADLQAGLSHQNLLTFNDLQCGLQTHRK